jgi:hypothetical protein
MEARAAFIAIKRALSDDSRKEVVSSSYDEEAFGNFIIAFRDEGRQRSIVNDRFELVISDNLNGADGRTVLASIREADERTILRALQL